MIIFSGMVCETSSTPVAHSSAGGSVTITSTGTSGMPSTHSPQSPSLGAGFLGRATATVIRANKIATVQEKRINYLVRETCTYFFLTKRNK